MIAKDRASSHPGLVNLEQVLAGYQSPSAGMDIATENVICQMRLGLAIAKFGRGESAEASEDCSTVIIQARRAGLFDLLGRASTLQGRIRAGLGLPCRDEYEVGLTFLDQQSMGRAEALIQFADILSQDDPERASRYLAEAKGICVSFQAHSWLGRIAEIEGELGPVGWT